MNPWGDVFHCFPVPEGPCGGPSQESHGWSSFPIIIPFEIPGALESWSLGQENTSSIATLAISVLGSHIVRIYFWDGPWEYPVFFFSFWVVLQCVRANGPRRTEQFGKVSGACRDVDLGAQHSLRAPKNGLHHARTISLCKICTWKKWCYFRFFGEGVGFLERGPAEKRSFHLHLRFFIVSSWSHALCVIAMCGISKTYCI